MMIFYKSKLWLVGMAIAGMFGLVVVQTQAAEPVPPPTRSKPAPIEQLSKPITAAPVSVGQKTSAAESAPVSTKPKPVPATPISESEKPPPLVQSAPSSATPKPVLVKPAPQPAKMDPPMGEQPSVKLEPVPMIPDRPLPQGRQNKGVLEVRPDSWQPTAVDDVIDSFDNAAQDYWRAAALMQPILTEDQFRHAAFAEGPLLVLPPKIFSRKPGMARWLLQERPMLGALHAGGTRRHCFFYPPTAGPLVQNEFILTARPLTLRALSAAKAAEFVENTKLSAVIYVDLLRMIDHLDEDMSWVAAKYAARIMQQILSDVEGFCSRAPSGAATRILAEYLARLEQPRFPISGYIEFEAKTQADWLMDDFRTVEEKLVRLYGEEELRPAVDKLMTLEAVEKEVRLSSWVDDYRRACSKIAKATLQPYKKAVKNLEKVDRARKKLVIDPAAVGVNPLIPLLLPPTLENYNRMILAEAQFGMLDLAVHAAAYQDYVKTWPSSLKELERFAGRRFPLDPFSDKPYLYALHAGKPRISCKAPKQLKRSPDLVTTLDFHDRLELDSANVEQVIEEEKERDMREIMREGGLLGEGAVNGEVLVPRGTQILGR